MNQGVDLNDADSVVGAVYFVVGRGTEGGAASYRLSIAGVTNRTWGVVDAVASNSGYTIGAIQVDLGQRGTWPLGETGDRALEEGEISYVDAIIEQASGYAERNGLQFTDDLPRLRSDLLSHGDGGLRPNGTRREEVSFIDTATRDSINAWAGSDEGKNWIHRNIDIAQVRNISTAATTMVEDFGQNIPEDRKFEVISMIAKTANQMPARLDRFETALKDGGDYDAVMAVGERLDSNISYYDGLKAAAIARRYQAEYSDPLKQAAMDRAHAKVSAEDYDPATEAGDLDIQQSLHAVGLRSRHLSYSEQVTLQLQENLNTLGFTDGRGRALVADGDFGPATRHAIEAFQSDRGIEVDGRLTPGIVEAIQDRVNELDPQQAFDRALQGIPAVDSSLSGRSDAGAAVQALRAGLSQPEGRQLQPCGPEPVFDDPRMQRLAAALLADDDAAVSRICAEIERSPEMAAMVRQGHETLAEQERQQQDAARQNEAQSQNLVHH
ncbi:peptidoglycan-binding domain-containing protein [Marilutibacter maris]|uniref:peptidoglycan-binding domain-containing protein n=1 Tax=Marilutibacter maris TaxID=1605891 RepID=UPI00167D46BE|nr:peptidoglycan-binding domain-containing protein [Lysobacter maris]